MSQPNGEPVVPPMGEPAGGNGQPGQGEPAGDPPDPAEDAAAASRRANNEARQLRTRLKAAEDAAAKWTAHQAQQQSAEQQWATERAELSTKATAAERKAWQYEAAADAGIPLGMAGRILGDDLDAMKADAKDLAKTLAPAAPVQPQRRRPDTSQAVGQQGGGASQPTPLNGDPIEEMLREHLGIR